MTKEQKHNRFLTQVTNKAWKRALVGLFFVMVAIAALVVVPFIYADTHAHSEYRRVTNEAERIVGLVSKAEGVLETWPPRGLAIAASGRGDGLMDKLACGPDISCPAVDRYLLVSVPNGDEGQFMSSLLKLSGYDNIPFEGCRPFDTDSSFCYEFRNNTKFRIFIGIDMADPYHHGAPEQDEISSPKVWRYLRISVEPKR